ncbi:MAG TPA: Holliday junction resolvase RuvX, partial [Planctomycetota bacterium]|nr:Holliday junction resolvase RuvX [Planctomycetota bacterium]
MGRILGIDFGDRWIGLALSDPGGIIASPLDVLDGEAALRDTLGHLVREKEIERLVVGLPVNMDGTLGPRAKRTLLFK